MNDTPIDISPVEISLYIMPAKGSSYRWLIVSDILTATIYEY